MMLPILEIIDDLKDMLEGEQLDAVEPIEDFGLQELNDLQCELRSDVPGLEGEEVIVSGNPFEMAEYLDYNQGDNPYNALGDCGLVSTSNFLNLCGIETDEDEVVGFALENNLCNDGWYVPDTSRGGTNDMQIMTILERYGVGTAVFTSSEAGGTVEDIAYNVENGRAATIGVNAGYFWNDANYIDDGRANHQVTVTGTVRDSETGELLGLTICDSGRGLESDAARFVSTEELEASYENVSGATVIYSEEMLRA